MTLSLDTNVAVDLLRRKRDDVRARFGQALAAGERIVMSTIVLAELSQGVRGSQRPDVQVRALDELLADLTMVDFDAGDAMIAGSILHELQTPGLPIGIADVFVAAQAVNRGWTIVTNDVSHFGRVQSLPIIDWRISDRPLDVREILTRLPRPPKEK